jgi:hypothetical protein
VIPLVKYNSTPRLLIRLKLDEWRNENDPCGT